MKTYIIKQYGNYRTLWVSKGEVQRVSCFSDEYVRVAKNRFKKSVPAWQQTMSVLPVTGSAYRWGVIDGEVYFDVEFLPADIRSKLLDREDVIEAQKELKGEVLETVKQKVFERIKEMKKESHERYYRYESVSKQFGEEAARLYAMRYAALSFLTSVVSRSAWIELGCGKKDEFFDVFCQVVSEHQVMKLNNRRVLRRKLEGFPLTGTEVEQLEYVIHGSVGNQNSRIVMKHKLVDMETGEQKEFDMHMTYMLMMYMNVGHSNKLRKVQAYERYCAKMGTFGLTPISNSTFDRYTNAFYNKALASLERDGYKAFNDQFNPYVAAYKLQHAGSMWAGDGSGSKLGFLDIDGKVRTLICVYIFDVASWKVVGYSIGEETGERVLDALKRAHEHCGGKMAKEFISDNGSAWTKGEVERRIKMCFDKVRNIAVRNSQENPAERIIYAMSEELRDQFNWLHSGFSGSFKNIDNKANGDYVNAKKLPNRSEAYDQLVSVIGRWNRNVGVDGLSPNERYEQTQRKDLSVLDARAYRYAFGMENKVDLSYMRGIVVVEYGGKKYEYDIVDYAQSMEKLTVATGMKGTVDVIVRHDGLTADLYNQEDAYLMTCDVLKKAHKASSEATPETSANLGRLKTKKKNFVEKAQAMTSEVIDCLELVEGGASAEVGYDNMASGQRKAEHRELEEAIVNEWFCGDAEASALDSL